VTSNYVNKLTLFSVHNGIEIHVKLDKKINQIDSFEKIKPAIINGEAKIQLTDLKVSNLLSVPFIFNGNLFGWLELGGRSTKYSEQELKQLEDIADIISRITYMKMGVEKDSQAKLLIDDKILLAGKMNTIAELASGVGHEVNNPLTIIVGYLMMLKQAIKKEPVSIEKISAILPPMEEAASKISSIIKELQQYAKVDITLREKISINDIIKKSINLFGEIYRRKGIELIVNLDAKNDIIYGNKSELQQVVLNLVTNAKDAMENANTKTLKISSMNFDGKIVLSFEDSGKGIPTEYRSRIFDAFFTTKSNNTGTGLGLTATQRIVNDMDGTIDVESRPGMTKFLVTIPNLKDS
jgi:signal transduction histidine kinase